MSEPQSKYNPHPLGKLPEHWQRPELEQVKKFGYEWNDPRDVIDIFEKEIAKYCGAPYFVVTDSCTHALELCFRYKIENGMLNVGQTIEIPTRTYVSAAMVIKKVGCKPVFKDYFWSGQYFMSESNWKENHIMAKPPIVVDSATRFTRNCYLKHSLSCLSFQQKKRLPIGRGGGILCQTEEQYKWLKLASYDGRDLTLPYDHPEHVKMVGYHYYITPEDAARGLIIFEELKQRTSEWPNTGNSEMYPDVQEMTKNFL